MQQSREEKGVSSTAERLARLHFIERLPKSHCDEGSPSGGDVVSYWRGTKEQTLRPVPMAWEFQGTQGASSDPLLPKCNPSYQYWGVQEPKTAKTPQPDPQLTGDSRGAFAPGARSQAIHGDDHCVGMSAALCMLSIAPAPAPAALPYPGPPHRFPKVLS